MGIKKKIHIHQQLMRQGKAAIIVKTYKGSTHHKQVTISGLADIYQYDEPDSCGARIVLVTRDTVYADGKMIK